MQLQLIHGFLLISPLFVIILKEQSLSVDIEFPPMVLPYLSSLRFGASFRNHQQHVDKYHLSYVYRNPFSFLFNHNPHALLNIYRPFPHLEPIYIVVLSFVFMNLSSNTSTKLSPLRTNLNKLGLRVIYLAWENFDMAMHQRVINPVLKITESRYTITIT